MAQRLQVDSGLRPERLRPVASPVDTFAPNDASSIQLARLANSLQDFGVSVGKFAGVMQERGAEQEAAKGEQFARELEEKRISYRDAVKQGLIPASANPWFQVGAKQQFGRAAAGKYAQDLQAAIENDPNMQSSTDPADYDKFEQEFRQTWLEQNVGKDNRDTHFEKGFGIVDGYAMDEGRRFIAAAGARLEKRAGESLGVIVGQVLDAHYKEGPETAATLINAEIKSYLHDNPKAGRIANLRTIDAVGDWARLNYKTVSREDVEAVLRQVDSGPGSKLFGTHEAKQMLNDVEKEIISMRGAAMNVEHAQQQAREKAAEGAFWTDVSTTMIEAAKNGTLAGADLTPLITRLNEITPDDGNAAKVQNLRESLLSARGNDGAMRNALAWVEGVSPVRPGQFLSLKQAVSYAAAEGLTAGQFNTVINAIQEREKRSAEGSPNSGSKLLGDRMYAAGEQYIRGKMLDPWGTNTVQARNAAEEAVRDFGIDFLSKDKEIRAITDPAKQNQYIQDLAEQSFRTHASPTILKEHNKEKGTAETNKESQSVFQKVMENATEADVHGLDAALLDYRAVQNGERPTFSGATKSLLTRLKVPMDDKELKLFFLEWERNH